MMPGVTCRPRPSMTMGEVERSERDANPLPTALTLPRSMSRSAFSSLPSGPQVQIVAPSTRMAGGAAAGPRPSIGERASRCFRSSLASARLAFSLDFRAFARAYQIDAAVHPDFAHLVLGIEIAVARDHGEVGDFAGLDRAESVLDA